MSSLNVVIRSACFAMMCTHDGVRLGVFVCRRRGQRRVQARLRRGSGAAARRPAAAAERRSGPLRALQQRHHAHSAGESLRAAVNSLFFITPFLQMCGSDGRSVHA